MRLAAFLFVLTCAGAARAESLADLAWLKGCWRTQGDGPVITETWTMPPAPVLLGFSYTIGEGEVQGWEAMRIEMGEGGPNFIAMPGGAPAVRFQIVEDDTPNVALFVNAAHDYPQRIEYRRDGNALTATIAKTDGSDAITFAYRRIRCPSELRP